MSTPNQAKINRAEINRKNAHHSTGPETEAGSQRSILGAMRYTPGTEQLVVSPDEDRELYHLHLRTFRNDYQPQGATEEHLVQSLADLSWRLNRVVALETNVLSISYSFRDLVDGLFDQAKALANLSLHSQRLSRQFERTVAQLRELQKTRRSQDQQGLDNLLDIMEVHQKKGQTYDPSPKTPPRMASFFQNPKSAEPSEPAVATVSLRKPTALPPRDALHARATIR